VFEAPWGFSLEQIVQLVGVGAEEVLKGIVAYAEKKLSGKIMGLLLR
jgi:hypothetical protein